MKSLVILFFLCILSFRAGAQTCVETFAMSYSGIRSQCDSYPTTCSPGGYMTKRSEWLYDAGGSFNYVVSCPLIDCDTGREFGGSSANMGLCADHQVPTLPQKPIVTSTNLCGSIIQIEDQIVGESIPIVGSSISLNFFSSWSQGRSADYKIYAPVTGPSPSGDLPSASYQLDGAGTTQVSSGTLSGTTPNQSFSYQWDGTSAGDETIGSEIFTSTTSYLHPRPPDLPLWIGLSNSFVMGSLKAKKLGLGGWLPNSFVFFDKNANRLIYGDGRFREVSVGTLGSDPYVFEEDGSKVYVFYPDGRHKFTKTTIHGSTLETYSYDSNGLLISITYPFSKVLSFNRNISGDLISITAPNGQTTNISFVAGKILSVTNPNSETYHVSYHSSGLINTFEKPNGEVSTFTYDGEGRLLSDSHSGGYSINLSLSQTSFSGSDVIVSTPLARNSTYSKVGSGSNFQRTEVLPNGINTVKYMSKGGYNRTESESRGALYVSNSNLGDKRFPGFESYNTTFSKSGYLGSVNESRNLNIQLTDDTDPWSITDWEHVYGLEGVPVWTTTLNTATGAYASVSSMGKTSEIITDSYERITSLKTGGLDAISFGYTNEKLTSIVRGTRTTSFAYNSADLVSTVTNALSQTTGFVYDLAGRVSSVVLPDSRVIGYGYNANGVLTSVTPPSRPAHIYGYNSSELFGSYQPPVLTGVSVVNTTYGYNSDKQLTTIGRPDGSSVSFNYSLTSGFMTDYTTPEGTFTQSMDTQSGMPNSIVRPDGSMTNIVYTDGVPTQVQNYSPAWDNWGLYSTSWTARKITSDTVTGTTTSVISYQYNNDQDLSKAGDVNISYHVPNGYITGTTMGSGTTGFTDSYTYNTYGEVTGYQAKRGTTVIYNLTLTRDALGRVSGKTQTMNSLTDSFVYTFDSTGRLAQTDKNSSTVATYSYDNNSNRNGGTIGAQPTTATYDDQDRMLTYNTLSFTYNANGDLTSKTNSTTSQTTTYTYDVFGNLRQVVIPPSTTVTYDIDGLNRRIAKRVNGTVQKRWVYMDQYRIAAELNSAGAITKRFIYGSKANIPDYMIASGVKYRIISDHLGSPRLVVKQSDGSIAQRMNHDEFGRVTEDTNPGYLPFGFAGGLYDNQTGLVRFGVRDYDPEVGRWTAKDPILFGGGQSNLYGYTFGDPVNFVDINGLYITDLTGDSRVSKYKNDPLYQLLANDPNVNVILTSQELGKDEYGDAYGSSKVINVRISPSMNMEDSAFRNTLMHELMHAFQIRNGNLKFPTSKANRVFAEKDASDFADRFYPEKAIPKVSCP